MQLMSSLARLTLGAVARAVPLNEDHRFLSASRQRRQLARGEDARRRVRGYEREVVTNFATS